MTTRPYILTRRARGQRARLSWCSILLMFLWGLRPGPRPSKNSWLVDDCVCHVLPACCKTPTFSLLAACLTVCRRASLRFRVMFAHDEMESCCSLLRMLTTKDTLVSPRITVTCKQTVVGPHFEVGRARPARSMPQCAHQNLERGREPWHEVVHVCCRMADSWMAARGTRANLRRYG